MAWRRATSLATQRLLLAKQLLTDTDQPVTQVALASGFDSLRRFNAAFAERYRMNPTRLRRDGARPAAASAQGLRLAWRPPYDLEAMLGFFARRALPGVEAVEGLTLRRTLAATHQGRRLDGWLSLRFVPERMRTAPERRRPAWRRCSARCCSACARPSTSTPTPSAIDPVLATLPVPPRAGTRLPGALDGFETAVRVVLGQQVTVKAARTLVQRLVAALRPADRDPLAGAGPPVSDRPRRWPPPTRRDRPAGHRAPARRRAAGPGHGRGRRPARAAPRRRRWPRRWTPCARCPASATGRRR